MQKSYPIGWRKLSPSLNAYSNLTILMQLMAYLKFVLVLPKCCNLYAQLNQDPQILKSDFILTIHFQPDFILYRGIFRETLIKGNVTCSNWKQLNSPIKFGGLGLRCSNE